MISTVFLSVSFAGETPSSPQNQPEEKRLTQKIKNKVWYLLGLKPKSDCESKLAQPLPLDDPENPHFEDHSPKSSSKSTWRSKAQASLLQGEETITENPPSAKFRIPSPDEFEGDPTIARIPSLSRSALISADAYEKAQNVKKISDRFLPKGIERKRIITLTPPIDGKEYTFSLLKTDVDYITARRGFVEIPYSSIKDIPFDELQQSGLLLEANILLFPDGENNQWTLKGLIEALKKVKTLKAHPVFSLEHANEVDLASIPQNLLSNTYVQLYSKSWTASSLAEQILRVKALGAYPSLVNENLSLLDFSKKPTELDLFSFVDMRGINANRLILAPNMVFEHTNLNGSRISASSNFNSAQFKNASLEALRMSGNTSCQNCVFEETTLEKAKLTDVAFEHTNFIESTLDGAVFENAHLTSTVFNQCQAEGITFKGKTSLQSAHFIGNKSNFALASFIGPAEFENHADFISMQDRLDYRTPTKELLDLRDTVFIDIPMHSAKFFGVFFRKTRIVRSLLNSSEFSYCVNSRLSLQDTQMDEGVRIHNSYYENSTFHASPEITQGFFSSVALTGALSWYENVGFDKFLEYPGIRKLKK